MKFQYIIFFFTLLIFSCKKQKSKKVASNIKTITSNIPFENRAFTVTASSELTGKSDGQYAPENAFDNDITTAWVEGNEGDGTNEWIQITFLKTQLIKDMTIHNGYQKSKETYKKNNRMSSFTIYINGKKTLIHSLDHEIEKSKTLQLNQFVQTLKIQVNEIEKGSLYADLCISDIEFNFADSTFKNFVQDTITPKQSDKKIAFQFKETPNRGYVLDKNMLFNDVLLTSSETQKVALFEHSDYIDFHAEEVLNSDTSFPFHMVRIYLQSEYDFDTYLHFIPKYNLVTNKNIFHESAASSDGGFSYKKMSFVDLNKDSYNDIQFTGGDCEYPDDCKGFKNEVVGVSKRLPNYTYTINFR